jgi:hypothetical protein
MAIFLFAAGCHPPDSEPDAEAGSELLWDLHYKELFRPGWQEVSTELLEGQRLVIHDMTAVSSVFPPQGNYLVVESDGVRCRRHRGSLNSAAKTGVVFFEKGTAVPRAYSGVAQCLSEHRFSEDGHSRSSEFQCLAIESQRLFLDGYAWPASSPEDPTPKALSKKRLRLVKGYLEPAALPPTTEESIAHGDSKTNAPTHEKLVPGVALTITEKKSYSEGHGIAYMESKGPPMTREQYQNLIELLSKDESPERVQHPGDAMTIRYRKESGDIATHSSDFPRLDRPELAAVSRWLHAVINHDCEIAAVAPPRAFVAEEDVE